MFLKYSIYRYFIFDVDLKLIDITIDIVETIVLSLRLMHVTVLICLKMS